jgi:hypothetical protein
MSSGARFIANRIGLGIMINNREIRELIDRKAEAVLHAAENTVPVESGDLKASLHVENDNTDRPVARVVADTEYADIVAARTGFLQIALDAARRA